MCHTGWSDSALTRYVLAPVIRPIGRIWLMVPVPFRSAPNKCEPILRSHSSTPGSSWEEREAGDAARSQPANRPALLAPCRRARRDRDRSKRIARPIEIAKIVYFAFRPPGRPWLTDQNGRSRNTRKASCMRNSSTGSRQSKASYALIAANTVIRTASRPPRSSPFSVSAGVAFSLIEQRELAIQPTPPSPESSRPMNKLGYSSQSTVNPAPMAMERMRLYEWDKHRSALHASFGVGVNVQGTNGGGSSAECLPGVRLSLFRTMHLTAGVSIAKQASLTGFDIGAEVPTTVTSPPIKTSYKAGAGFAVTFTSPSCTNRRQFPHSLRAKLLRVTSITDVTRHR